MNTGTAARLYQIANQSGVRLFIPPAQRQDIHNDLDATRRDLRLQLVNKYALLLDPPPIKRSLESMIGRAQPGSNEFVDHMLLAAVSADAVHYLVTEEVGIHRKAKRLGLDHRVLRLADAVDMLSNLFDRTPSAPAAVQHLKAYNLDSSDPIWQSLREDYAPFDEWLTKCKREQRDTWVIRGQSGYGGVAIVNREKSPPPELSGKVLKLCTFKISRENQGMRYGELLLKAVFGFAAENGYDWVFVEVFGKHHHLLDMLGDFGFLKVSEREGQHVLSKPMRPGLTDENLFGLRFNRRFGPFHVDWSQPAYVVPIEPRFEELLFPDFQMQPSLLSGEHTFGNSLRKAYLSHSPIESIRSGAILVFYRSQDESAITNVGVVEEVMRSSNPEKVAAFVGKRTVYSLDQIRSLIHSSNLLAINFRHAHQITPHIRLHDLIDNGVLSAAPQSITSIPSTGKKWIATRLRQ